MEKNKAIQLLERLQDPEPYEPMLTKDAYDAIQMAIDALSADGDTISRKAAIDAVNCVTVMKGIRGGKGVAAEAVESAKRIMTDNIRQLPSTQLEIVKCKDCKYWNSGYCECPGHVIDTEAEHFCGYADKKEVTTWAKSN